MLLPCHPRLYHLFTGPSRINQLSDPAFCLHQHKFYWHLKGCLLFHVELCPRRGCLPVWPGCLLVGMVYGRALNPVNTAALTGGVMSRECVHHILGFLLNFTSLAFHTYRNMGTMRWLDGDHVFVGLSLTAFCSFAL